MSLDLRNFRGTYQRRGLPSPSISSIDPAIAPLVAGTSVTIKGNNLSGAQDVLVGGIECTSVTQVDANTVTAVLPTLAAGFQDVRVITAGGESAALASALLAISMSLWLRADRGITLTSGKVSGWADQSGQGMNATQGTAAHQPTIRAIINGQSTIFFDASGIAGTEKYFDVPSLAALTASHILVVNQRVNAVPSEVRKTGFYRLGTSTQLSHVPYTDNTIYDDGGSTVRAAAGTAVVALSTPNVYEVENQTGSLVIRINGVTQFTRGTNTPGLTTFPQLGGSDTGAYFDGDWAEVILYSRVLSSSERASVISYLNNRYALGAS